MLSQVQTSFITELWIEFAVGFFVFALRFFARWKTVGFSNFAWDDYWAGVSVLFWICGLATLDTTVRHGTNVGLTEETALEIPPEVVKSLEYGSKALFAAWFLYVTIIWTLKATVLGYYSRLTEGLWQNKLVKVMSVVCFLSWSSMIILIFCRCTPIEKNWQIVPYAGDKCTHTTSSVLALMLLNIFDDIGLVAIPALVLYEAKLPLRRKAVVALLLSSSFFIIACALLRGIIGLQSIANILVSIQWGTREAFVTIIVINVPAIRPLFSRRPTTSTTTSRSGGAAYSFHTFDPKYSPSQGGAVRLRDASAGTGRKIADDERSLGSSSCKDLIVNVARADEGLEYGSLGRAMRKDSKSMLYGISVTTEVNIENDSEEDVRKDRKKSAVPSDWDGSVETQVVGGRDSRLSNHRDASP